MAATVQSVDATAAGEQELTDGFHLVIDALKLNGIKTIYAVPGIPITDFLRMSQAEGIRVLSFRHEQNAGYAASIAGYLTKQPGICLTVSAPGFLNGFRLGPRLLRPAGLSACGARGARLLAPAVSTAVTLHFLAGAIVAANVPALYRRFGLPAVTNAAAFALAAGVAGWALAATPWQLFAATVVSGAGWAAMGGVAVNAVVSPWFVRARPAALGTAYNGASFAGLIFSPLWVAAIAVAAGFRLAAAAIGVVTIVVRGVLASRFFARTPAADGARAGRRRARRARSRR